jgi:hypothetical protein
MFESPADLLPGQAERVQQVRRPKTGNWRDDTPVAEAAPIGGLLTPRRVRA